MRFSMHWNRPRRILFDHIPKCAGSSLGLYLRGHYPRRKTFSCNGQRPHQSVHQFRAFSHKRRFSYHLVIGHQAGCLSDVVHSDCLKVTLLREPIDRIVSHYYYAKGNVKHYLYERIHRERLSLKNYVEMGVSRELRNHYTRHFSGMSLQEIEKDPGKAVEQAMESLNDYDLVGFQNEFESFVEKLQRAACLDLPFLQKKVNAGEGRLSVDDLDMETLQTIRENNLLDLELYEKANNV